MIRAETALARDPEILVDLTSGVNAFEAEVSADKALQERARESARQSLRSLFVGLGFTEAAFVDQLPPEPKRG